MTWTLLLGQLPGTLLLLGICLAGAAACLVLGMRVEREHVDREIRAGRLVVVPDEYELARALEPYTEIEGWR